MVRIRHGALIALWACSAFDREPPTLSVALPTAAVRGELALEIVAQDTAPGLDRLAVSIAGEPLARAPNGWHLDTHTLPDGVHPVQVLARDGSVFANETSWEGALTIDFALAPAEASQGRTLVLWVRPSESVTEVSALLQDRRIPLHPVQDHWRGLMGVDLRAEPGTHPVEIEARDAAGNLGRSTFEYRVHPGNFTKGGRIALTAAQVAARKDEAAKAETRREREAAYAHEEPRQLWTEPFHIPVKGRLTSPFGRYRSYSDGQRSYHTGMDLAARRGTPVVATAAGEVLVAGWQAIFGNVVILHHGQGLTTSYNHLDAVQVAVGETLLAGEVVGLLGSTGQSTGPHLHWGVTVAGTAVDPAQWLEPDFWEGLDRPKRPPSPD